MQDWAVQRKFHYEISHKDTDRVIYRCRYHDMDDLGCDWRVRANRTDEGDIKITVFEDGHTCIIPLAMRSVGVYSVAKKKMYLEGF